MEFTHKKHTNIKTCKTSRRAHIHYKTPNVTAQKQTGNLRVPSRTKRHSDKKTRHCVIYTACDTAR